MKKVGLPRKTTLRILLITLLLANVYLGVCLLLRWGQTRLMFFPSATLKTTPSAVGLAYEEVRLSMPKGLVYGWWIPTTANAPIVLYLHGNGSNLGDLVGRAKRLHQLGIAVLLIDYRGYGRSWGTFPNEASVYEDAEASWRYLTKIRQIAPKQIIFYGQSIGGAVAIELATRHPDAAGVIVESSFTSMQAMVKRTIPQYLLPTDWLLTERFDSLSKVRWLQIPILLIHGTADETIPVRMSQDLFAASPNPKQLLLVTDAGHNNVPQVAGKLYLQTVQKFINQTYQVKLKSAIQGEALEHSLAGFSLQSLTDSSSSFPYAA